MGARDSFVSGQIRDQAEWGAGGKGQAKAPIVAVSASRAKPVSRVGRSDKLSAPRGRPAGDSLYDRARGPGPRERAQEGTTYGADKCQTLLLEEWPIMFGQ